MANSDPAGAPVGIFVVTQTLYFTATNGSQGFELWRIGPSGVLQLAADIDPGPASSGPSHFLSFNDELYFTAETSAHGVELYRVAADGGVAEVADLNPGPAGSTPFELVVVNGALYFTATVGGTFELCKIGPDGLPTLAFEALDYGIDIPRYAIGFKGEVYFTASTQAHGNELWKLGAEGVPVEVADLYPGATGSNISDLTVVGNSLYFVANTPLSGTELWRMRAGSAPVLVKDIAPKAASSQPNILKVVGGEIYFQATTAAHGNELWKVRSDGVAIEVADINPGSASSYPSQITSFNGEVYFSAQDAAGFELWKIKADGTVLQVADIDASGMSSGPTDLMVVGDSLYFAAFSTAVGQELWKLGPDGAVALLADLVSGTGSSFPTSLVNIDGVLYFHASTSGSGRELWRLLPNGTVEQVVDLNPGPSGSVNLPMDFGIQTVGSPPSITSHGGTANVAISHPENVAPVATLIASDPDSLDLSYSLIGADAFLFDISSAGVLSFSTPPDFEQPKDVGHDNIYNVTVLVEDAEHHSDTQAFTITITDVKGITYNGGNTGKKKSGTPEADTLKGNGGNDTLKGSGGKDSVDGGSGNDKLFGGDSKDKLTGGTGKDTFVFNTALATAGVDKITDFNHADDTIQLSHTVFAALGTSVASNEFVLRAHGHAATKASHHLIYDQSKGSLWYDSDGKGIGAAVQIAQLGTTAHHPTDLSHDDFIIV